VQIPLIDAITNPRLLGATVRWRAKQLEVLRLFGDDDLHLVVCAAGRQGGKSTMAALSPTGAAVRLSTFGLAAGASSRSDPGVRLRTTPSRSGPLHMCSTAMILAARRALPSGT
jgi:hypothetical protein